MSIATEVTRLTTLRNNIRSKLITLGIISDESADLQDCYEGIYSVPGRTYADLNTVNRITTVPSGYYDEALTVENPTGVKYYLSGSSAPTSSIGADGDLYLQTSGAADWYANDLEHVSQLYTHVYALADTEYNTWTPSTSAKAIQASTTATTFTANMLDYEYVLRWRLYFEPVYNSGTTLKAAIFKQSHEILQVLYRRPGNRTNVLANSFTDNGCSTLTTFGLAQYYDSSGTLKAGYTASYGIYFAATAATFSSDTSDTPTITVKTPAINARCNTTYFSTTMGNAVNKTSSKFILIGDLYRRNPGGIQRSIVKSIVDMQLNPPSFS